MNVQTATALVLAHTAGMERLDMLRVQIEHARYLTIQVNEREFVFDLACDAPGDLGGIVMPSITSRSWMCEPCRCLGVIRGLKCPACEGWGWMPDRCEVERTIGVSRRTVEGCGRA